MKSEAATKPDCSLQHPQHRLASRAAKILKRKKSQLAPGTSGMEEPLMGAMKVREKISIIVTVNDFRFGC